MRLLVFCLLSVLVSCSSYNKCHSSAGESIINLIKSHNNPDPVLKLDVINLVCDSISHSNVLYLAERNQFNDNVYGLVYFYDSDTFVSFGRQSGDQRVQLLAKDNRKDLIMILEKIKNNSDYESQKLKNKYDSLPLHDVPFLELTFINISKNDLSSFVFPYVSETVLNNQYKKDLIKRNIQ